MFKKDFSIFFLLDQCVCVCVSFLPQEFGISHQTSGTGVIVGMNHCVGLEIETSYSVRAAIPLNH